MACDDRQLTQAQRAAAFGQQRTGVVRAVRPFSGSPTVENLVDYINRELGPAVRSAREAVNDVYLQVADNAPSANPLAFYFSTDTTNADPTTGRIRLNASPQNTATVMRVSQTNGRLIDVLPWLDVMAGGPTIPLGVVTLVDAINPARFIRWDLNTMTDMGLYWDLGITIIESSDTDPFVEDEAVVVGFISGVSAAGSTIPIAALSPIAPDTFVGNITAATAPPAAVPWVNVDSTSLIYDTVSHTMQRAALTGAVASAQNANTTLFAGIRDNGTAENDRANLNHLSTTSVVSVVTDDAANDELEITLERAALTGFAVAAQNSNATTSAEPIVTYTASANMSAERVATSSTSVTVSIATANQIDWQRAALTGDVTAPANSNATTIANDAVTNAKLANMAAGTQKGRQIDSGAAGDPVDLAGAEQAENIRYDTRQDTTATGTQNNFALGDTTTELVFGGGTATYTGFALNSIVPGGKAFIFRVDTGSTAIFSHLNGGSTSTQQIACPGEVDLVLGERSAVWVYESDSKWRVISLPRASQQFTDVISPTAISADQNNYNPTGWSTANVVRLITNNTTARAITGAQAGTAGEVKVLLNIGVDTVNANITLNLENASSTAANRWASIPGTTLVTLQTGCIVWYDGTSSRWRFASAF
jgi:hypothetical protein